MRRRSGRDRSGHAGRDAGLDLAVRCGGTTGRGSAASTTGRRLGLSIDNLIEADVVLADGSFFTANEEAHPDLLWALRGGGGNFGVVTRFSFRLSPVSTVVAGPTLWPLDRAAEILSWYRDFIRDAPEELSGWFAFLTVPPAPPFPEHLQLQKMCGIVWCWSGDPDEAEQALGPARAPWRSDLVSEIPDEAVEAHVEYAQTLPTWKSAMHLYPINGAATRPGSADSAWTKRDGGRAQRVDDLVLGDAPRVLGRRRLCEHDDGGGPGSGPCGLRVELRPACAGQGRVRPEQRLPREQNIKPA